MTQRNTLELARQGDPSAIAELIRRSLNPKGIKVKVNRKDDCLKILLESNHPLPKDSLITFVENGINKLEIENIRTPHVWGLKSGEKKSSWHQVVSLLSVQPPQKNQTTE